jgi:hypothetical protein
LTPLPGYSPSILQVGVVPVTAGPGDQGAADAAARGYLRASHADREHVIDVLKAAFVQGRLTKDELHARVDQTFASRTYAELAEVIADIPTGLARPGPVRKPARGERTRPVARPGLVISVATGLYAGVWPLALLVPWSGGVDGDSAAAAMLVVIATLVYVLVVLISVGHMIAARRNKRPGAQPPPRRAQAGSALGGERDGGPGNDLMRCQAHRDTHACRPPEHSVTQRIWRSVSARRVSAGLRPSPSP